jgi:hypothetical protein
VFNDPDWYRSAFLETSVGTHLMSNLAGLKLFGRRPSAPLAALDHDGESRLLEVVGEAAVSTRLQRLIATASLASSSRFAFFLLDLTCLA